MGRYLRLGATLLVAITAGLLVTAGLALRAVDDDREPGDIRHDGWADEGVDDDGFDDDYDGTDDWWARLVA
jgi:hypothetical protein